MIIVLLNMYMYVRRLTSYVTIEICTGFFFLWGGGGGSGALCSLGTRPGTIEASALS